MARKKKIMKIMPTVKGFFQTENLTLRLTYVLNMDDKKTALEHTFDTTELCGKLQLNITLPY